MEYNNIENFIRSFNGYEDKNGIKPLKVYELKKNKDIAIWIKESNNGQTGFFIVYECAVRSNNWLFWCPSENQIMFLQDELKGLYKHMEILREDLKNGVHNSEEVWK